MVDGRRDVGIVSETLVVTHIRPLRSEIHSVDPAIVIDGHRNIDVASLITHIGHLNGKIGGQLPLDG
jgi:hypothetical protein